MSKPDVTIDFLRDLEVDGPTLAAALNLDIRTITRLANEGVVQKRGRGKYLFLNSITAYVETLRAGRRQEKGGEKAATAYDYENERGRLYKEKADRAEMENAVMRGELHHGEAVAATVNDMLARFRARMLSLPVKAAPLVAEETSIAVCQDIIEREAYEVLTELSEYDPAPVVKDSLARFLAEKDEEGDATASGSTN